jgi:2-keto-4-pentenoate hydratase/2-oxohepta-3-ene-1,7-dioic acid hydratase in catechol pathway
MKLGSLDGRAMLVVGDDNVVDIATASGGRFAPDVQQAYQRWDELREFADALNPERAGLRAADPATFDNPVPTPRQVFGIGLNYADHASEARFAVPTQPPVFTKFPTCLTGPSGVITLPAGHVDWEVELVVVIGRTAVRVGEDTAWEHVAGLSVGQDISERVLQHTGPAPQFSLGKSYPGFGPIGPVVVTPDEVPDRDDLELGCVLNGEQVQLGHTKDMIFAVPELIARLSAVTPLLPGDVIFTGTPAGVGHGRTPQRFLSPGDELVTTISGIGTMRHTFAR